jgi:hypothetical protein
VAWLAIDLAAITIRNPEASNGRCKRQISRNLRRTRLRVTASPRRRGVIKPKRVPPAAGSCATLNRNNRPCAERPCDRTSANSRLNLMRTARGNPSLLGFGVPGVWDFDTLGQQAFATALAPTAQNRAATLRFHSSAKTELALTRALAWLVGAFHKIGKNGARQNTLSGPRVNRGIPGQRLSEGNLLSPSSSDGGPRRSDKVRQNPAIQAPSKDQSP